jgi:hypothetical protein
MDCAIGGGRGKKMLLWRPGEGVDRTAGVTAIGSNQRTSGKIPDLHLLIGSNGSDK